MVAPGFDAPLTQKMEFYDGKPLSSTTSTSSHILTLTLTLIWRPPVLLSTGLEWTRAGGLE